MGSDALFCIANLIKCYRRSFSAVLLPRGVYKVLNVGVPILKSKHYSMLSRVHIMHYQFMSPQISDVAGQAQLLTSGQFLKDQGVEEDALFCHPLQTHTTGEEMFYCA